MENFILVSQQVWVLFALVGLGAVARWTRLVDDGAIKGIVNVLLLLVTPSLIIDVFQRPFEAAMLRQLGISFAIASSSATGYPSARAVSCMVMTILARVSPSVPSKSKMMSRSMYQEREAPCQRRMLSHSALPVWGVTTSMEGLQMSAPMCTKVLT